MSYCKEQVVRTDLVHDGDRLRRAVEVEARDVVGVDRLDQQLQVRASSIPAA
jgi:hypothetical protein